MRQMSAVPNSILRPLVLFADPVQIQAHRFPFSRNLLESGFRLLYQFGVLSDLLVRIMRFDRRVGLRQPLLLVQRPGSFEVTIC